ncbi:MAG: hypothetical protein ACREV9_14090 [Burkholderiales bacterium]
MNEITQAALANAWRMGSKTFLESAENIFKFQVSFALKAYDEYLRNAKSIVAADRDSMADEWASLYQESVQRMQDVARAFLEATRETQTRSRQIADELMRDSTRALAGNLEQINKALIEGNAAAMAMLNGEEPKVEATPTVKRIRSAA